MRSVKSLIAAGAAITVVVGGVCRRHADRAAADVCAAAGRGFRRLVSARRYRLQQSARRSAEQRARRHRHRRRCRTNSFNTAGIFGLGVGYRFNNWFRADVTGEYRGNSQFYGNDRHHLSRRRRHRHLSRHQVGMGGSRPTPMSISAPGGASRRSSAPASAARGSRSRTSPTPASPTLAASRCRASPSATARRSGIWPGRCMPVSPTGSRRTSPSNSPIAISTWATA